MKTIVLKKIRNGRYYRPGDEIELEAAEYKRLLKLGAVRRVKEEKKPTDELPAEPVSEPPAEPEAAKPPKAASKTSKK